MAHATRFVGLNISKMTACIEADADLAAKAEVLMALKGIGLRTACFLLADLPEPGLIDKGQIAKLVGVAPLNRDSGIMRGKRMIAGGRRQIRDARMRDHLTKPLAT